jgi:hypothetical protein
MNHLDPKFSHKQSLSPAAITSAVNAVLASPSVSNTITALISSLLAGGGGLRTQLAFVSIQSTRRKLTVVEDSLRNELFTSLGDPVLGLEVEGMELLKTSSGQPIVSHV